MIDATPFAEYVCMTTYDKTFPLPIAFPKESYPDIFPEILARNGKTPEVRKKAMQSLSNSRDPRALSYLEDVLKK